MNVFLCGLWNGVHLWMQWDDFAPDAGYRLRIRLRKPPAQGWGQWQLVENLRPYRKDWIVFPVNREGQEIQAEIGSVNAPDWFRAQEVTFSRSACQFRISTQKRPLRIPKGAEFHSVVDGAACHYWLDQEIDLQAGQDVVVGMTASVASGYCQLDHPGDFSLSPALGVLIENIAPSSNDIVQTGRDYTKLMPVPRDSPLKVVFGAENFFNGNA